MIQANDIEMDGEITSNASAGRQPGIVLVTALRYLWASGPTEVVHVGCH